MNDEIIVDWYLQKNQKAITESAAQYGTKLKRISFNIVQNMSDAEECENDTYLSAWNMHTTPFPKAIFVFFFSKDHTKLKEWFIKYLAATVNDSRASKSAKHMKLILQCQKQK